MYLYDNPHSRGTTTPASAPTGSGARSEDVMEQTTIAPTSKVTRIFMATIQTRTLSAEDVKYVGQIVSQRTGLTQQAAEKRVSDTYARIQAKLHDAEVATKDAANKARQASAYAALWIFVSLLRGAFVASLAATYGRRRAQPLTIIRTFYFGGNNALNTSLLTRHSHHHSDRVIRTLNEIHPHQI